MTSKPSEGLSGCWLSMLGLLLFGLFAGVSFLLGFWVHATERPPYKAVMTAYYSLRSSDSVRALWFRWTGRSQRTGVWTTAPPDAEASSPLQQERMRQLEAIGYVGASEQAPEFSGITLYDPERAWPGYNLYTSGHAPTAILTDMQGRELHSWSVAYDRAFPDRPKPVGTYGVDHWRRAYLYPNGDLLAIYDGLGLIKLDRDSNLIWVRADGSHHDLEVLEDGSIYVLTRKARVLPSLHPWKPILEDFITVVNPDGSERGSYSIVEAFLNSRYASALQYSQDGGDIFHTNTLEVLDGRHVHLLPAFRAGNVLISLNETSVIAIIDLASNAVVWMMAGMSEGQHDPTLIENGNILMLDNLGHHGYSKVVEFHPATQEVVWAYYGDRENGFRTPVCGFSQRLPNGNTLITESTAGHVFEVTADGTRVWEFFNPYRSGDADELIANIFVLRRLDPNYPLDWLERSSS